VIGDSRHYSYLLVTILRSICARVRRAAMVIEDFVFSIVSRGEAEVTNCDQICFLLSSLLCHIK
jgi:hypothetical protein